MADDANTAPSTAALAVLGAGAWGCGVARLLAANGHAVRLWAHRRERADELRAAPPAAGMLIADDLAEVVNGADAAFVVVPSRAYLEVAERLRSVGPPRLLVSCAKGFLDARLRRLSEPLAALGTHVAVLSGPNLAGEIARGLPSAATIACHDDADAQRVQAWLTQPSFRVYRSRDVVGVEVCGALKNVIALAAGMSDELGLGANAHAALVTRGLAELARLGGALGGDPRTFYGLAGLGDLIATCSSSASRNHQVGARIARGEPIEAIRASGITAEGVHSVRHVVRYARRGGIDLPICFAVEAVIDHGKPPRAALDELMRRAPRAE